MSGRNSTTWNSLDLHNPRNNQRQREFPSEPEQRSQRSADTAGGIESSTTCRIRDTNEAKADQSQRTAHDNSQQQIADAERETHRLLTLRSDRLRSLGQLTAGIAHELNQPLVGVRGLAEHLLIGMDRGWNLSDEKIRNKLSLIIAQADRMTHIIQRVRSFASGAGQPEISLVRVNDVVRRTMIMLTPQLRDRSIVLDCELASGIPLIRANPMSLEEVVLNLAVNAADAMSERIEARVHLTPLRVLVRTQTTHKDNQQFVQIQVIDRGIGIPENLLPRMFEPFLTTKGPDRGTGLGLAICRDLVEQVAGTISIESAVGQGTTVTVSFPAATVADEELS